MKGCTKVCRFVDKIPKRVVMTLLVFLITGQGQFFKSVQMTMMRTMMEADLIDNEHMEDADRVRLNQTICPQLAREESPPPYKDLRETDYNWNHSYYKVVNKYYFVGFAAASLPVGILSDMYGGKHFLTGIVVTGTLSTILAPFLIHGTGGSLLVMKIIRGITGAVMGALGPASYSVLAHWVPPNERGRLCGTALTGANFGVTIYFPITAMAIKKTRDYATPFYMYSLTGLLLIIAWHFIGTSTPYQKKDITGNEKLYLDTEMGSSVDHRRKKRVPILRMLLSLDVWAYLLPAAIYLWSWNMYVYMMKVYMVNVLKQSSVKDKSATTVLFATTAVTGVTSCFLSDWALNSHTVSRTTIRKIFTTLGLMGPAIFLLAGTYGYCSIKLTGTMFMISGALCGFVIAGVSLIPYDLSPNFPGTLVGFGAALSFIFGLLVDKLIFKMMKDKTLVQYRKVFWIICAVTAFCNYFFTLFGSANEKGWNKTGQRRLRRQLS